MSYAEDWLAAAARVERARVRSDARRLVRHVGAIGEKVCREHPIASVALATVVGLGLAGAAAGSSSERPRRRRRGRGLIGSSLTGALRSYLVHVLSASLAPERAEASAGTPSAEKSSRT